MFKFIEFSMSDHKLLLFVKDYIEKEIFFFFKEKLWMPLTGSPLFL